MRGTLRLFASVKPVRYLEAGAPTGLTGLRTNASPRSTLLYLYHRTLDKLADVPETSLYRQSVEAVTKHRLSLVQAAKPDGYDEWAARTKATIEQHPEQFTDKTQPGQSPWSSNSNYPAEREWSYLEGLSLDGGKSYYLRPRLFEEVDERIEDVADLARMEKEPPSEEEEAASRGRMLTGEELNRFTSPDVLPKLVKDAEELDRLVKEKGAATEEDLNRLTKEFLAGQEAKPVTKETDASEQEDLVLEKEPVWNADQIEELENKIGAGLIEEVIQVAEGELHLVDTMKTSQVWESLEDKPQEGQWAYFERKE